MISLLQSIVDHFVCWVQTGVTDTINALVIALAAVVSVVTALMPTIPSAPSLPGPMTTALAWIAWFFPIGTLIDIMAFLLTAWLIWIGVSVVLRWVRVLS